MTYQYASRRMDELEEKESDLQSQLDALCGECPEVGADIEWRLQGVRGAIADEQLYLSKNVGRRNW